jgi:branched-chain amino acid aminotransferase
MKTPLRILPMADAPVVVPDILGFGRHFTRRMLTQKFSPERGWHDAQIGPYQALSLDPATQLFHCGQMIFEGTKAYRRPDGDVNLFRPWDNAKRFNRSAQRMAMPELDVDWHVDAIAELVRLEQAWTPSQDGAALYVRPVMISLDATLEVRASRNFLHYIILSPAAPYFSGGFKSVSVLISDDYVRAVRGGTGEAKTPGNYAGSLAGTETALAAGYQQVLWLDAVERRFVDEVGAMNIAFVYQGKHIVTPALAGGILPGITRDSLLALAPELGFTVEQSRIDIGDVIRDIARGHISEAFAMGTAAVIAPIGRLGYRNNDYVIHDNWPGPVATRLYGSLSDIQYGRTPDLFGWTRRVSCPGSQS